MEAAFYLKPLVLPFALPFVADHEGLMFLLLAYQLACWRARKIRVSLEPC
jgi:hypothetical protein